MADPIKTLIYAASGADVETVIVDGQIIVENGAVPGVDEAQLLQQATEAHLWQRDRFVTQHPSGRSVGELFPTTYESVNHQTK
ncbi:hypothetical protein KFU94_30260 [Chloroflexi bacterium TSY]|nr:hypothetical protein [Chloroflexi bacterium TSY]